MFNITAPTHILPCLYPDNWQQMPFELTYAVGLIIANKSSSLALRRYYFIRGGDMTSTSTLQRQSLQQGNREF